MRVIKDGGFLYRKERLPIFQKVLLNRKTKAELAFEVILNELGIIYEAQKILIDANAITDYYVPSLKMCYEIDGSWHDNRGKKDTDRNRRIRRLHNIGIKHFKNEEVLETPELVKVALINHVDRRKKRGQYKRKKLIGPKVKTRNKSLNWYDYPVNVVPELRFKFRSTNPNSYRIMRLENKVKKNKRLNRAKTKDNFNI